MNEWMNQAKAKTQTEAATKNIKKEKSYVCNVCTFWMLCEANKKRRTDQKTLNGNDSHFTTYTYEYVHVHGHQLDTHDQYFGVEHEKRLAIYSKWNRIYFPHSEIRIRIWYKCANVIPKLMKSKNEIPANQQLSTASIATHKKKTKTQTPNISSHRECMCVAVVTCVWKILSLWICTIKIHWTFPFSEVNLFAKNLMDGIFIYYPQS